MMLNRAQVLAAYLLVCLSTANSLKTEDSEFELQKNDDPHPIQKRALRIISMPPENGAGEPYKGWNFMKHADNAIQGGKIGVELDTKLLSGKVGSIWRRLRKFMSGRGWKKGNPDEFPDNKFPGDKFPGDKFPDGEFPDDMFPVGEFPEDKPKDGELPEVGRGRSIEEDGEVISAGLDPRKRFGNNREYEKMMNVF